MLILTPNRRLAAFSLQQHNKTSLDNELDVWSTPQFRPMENWLNDLWLCCRAYQPVLTLNQQQFLVEQIIDESKQGVELLRLTPTAKSVLDAWRYMQQWDISVEKIQAYADYSLDTYVFCEWINSYRVWLQENSWTDTQSIARNVLAHIEEIISFLPRQIYLRGIQDVSPIHQKILKSIEQHGVVIIKEQIIRPGANVVRSAFGNVEQEINSAAKWASEQHGMQTAVIVPQLELQRQNVVNKFLEYMPLTELNVSAPLPLSEYALIDSALLILQQAKPVLDYNDVSILLRSPYVNAGLYCQNSRARIDRMFRCHVGAKIKTGKNLYNDKHKAHYWAELMNLLLLQWGWPGNDKLTIEESDLYTCWHNLLKEYSALDSVNAPHTYAQALQYVRRLASNTPFAAAEVGETRVHVLGMLEAEGIAFDKLWVMGMTREEWPLEAKPNPFIPLELQRAYNLPRSSAQRELEVAKRLTTNMRMGGSKEVVFSYSLLTDNATSAPSNLITDLPEVTMPSSARSINTCEMQHYTDDNSPKLRKTKVRGGTRVLRLQAECPFKANAEIRLHANPLLEPQLFLTPAQRGTIVHEILEWYWLEQAQIDITEIIEQVLISWRRQLPHILTDNYFMLERNRLYDLLQRWVAYENQRSAFKVMQLEKRYAVQIGNLSMNIQVDRIDRLEDGTNLVIDYKTGNPQTNDPQLAIYAKCVSPNSAIYYVKADKIKISQYAPREEIDLEKLSQEFIDGVSAVAPISKQICASCDLQAMCRIYDN